VSVSIDFSIQRQPDDSSCGPTCLHAVYRYYGLQKPLSQLMSEVQMLREGGTLAVFLGIVTSDANILLIRPRKHGKQSSDPMA
jgi:hypothetical protein